MNFSEVAFFGDSWVEGAELKTNQDNFVKILGAKNYGRQGSSIPGLLQIFHECKEKNFKVAVFCLGEPSRIIYYSNKDFYLDSNAGYGKKGHPLHDTHQKLMAMSTDYDQDFRVSQNVYVLYKWCLDLNITPYFVNMWTSQLSQSFIWNLIPKETFLLPITNNIVKQVFDTTEFFPVQDHVDDWWHWLHAKNKDFKEFIYPNKYHPNELGHQKIAKWFEEKINKST